MKFTANRLLLYEAAKTVLKTVRQNKEIPEISGILIEADAESGILTLTGTDIRTHICRDICYRKSAQLQKQRGRTGHRLFQCDGLAFYCGIHHAVFFQRLSDYC